jgi:uncharacterized membrane protein YqgA involved in biofilm formation
MMATLEALMESVSIMQTVIMVLVGVIFGLLLGLNYKFDKLVKAINEPKTSTEK